MPRLPHCSSRFPARRLFLLLSLLACTAVAAPLRAHASDATPWNLIVGDAMRDTLDVPLDHALEAGRWVLRHDQWTLEPGDSTTPRFVTRWKPVRHPLVRFVTGDARVRVAVTLRALSAARTEVTMQGGIATETNLQGSPVLGLARTAGEHECLSYFDEVRARIADESVAHAATALGGTAPAPASVRR